MNSNTAAFIQTVRHPIKFRLFLLTKLPSAYFAGVRLREIDETICVTTVPYKWFSRNPFRSTYFACLAMAAEMTTGALAMVHLYKRKPAVSMLVVKVEGDYFKKAVGRSRFTCSDGDMIKKAIEDCISTGEAKTIRAKSIGVNEEGEAIAEFFITWSFKARKN